jgi:hypothetical protein
MIEINTSNRELRKTYAFLTIFLVSCSMLMFEILLTRICALRLFFHFGFLVVSNCLLGIGASGSMIFILQKKFAKHERLFIWFFSAVFIVSLIITYAFLINYKIDEAMDFNSLKSMLRFSVFNLVSAIPFFFAGTVIGLILTFNATDVNTVYGVDLLGAGLGCLICPLLLWQSGAGGCMVFITLLALLAMIAACPDVYRRVIIVVGVVLGVCGLIMLPNIDKWFPVPSKNDMAITGEVDLALQKNITYSQWSATSRIDLIDLDPAKRFIFGLGQKSSFDEKVKGASKQIPDEKWIQQDGSSGTFILNFSDNPSALSFIAQSLYSLGPMLKREPRVFIIGVGGGNDVWAAKINGAKYIKGIELNKQIVDIHRKVLPHFSRAIIEDPNIELVFDEGRSALMRDLTTYDVIQMSGIDTWTSLASGAYVLAENYLYTVEAIKTMYGKLSADGIISISRFASTMETTRLLSNIFAACDGIGQEKLQGSIVCLGNGAIRTILLKKGQFSNDELAKLDDFADRWGFEFVYHPGKNINSTEEKFVRTADKEKFIRDFSRNIAPTTDDQPYFFNYFKWTNLFASNNNLNQHPSFAQGSPRFIFGQLLLSTILALSFILLPVVVFMRKSMDRSYLKRYLVYFTGLGLGFISIEIVLMQKLVLFLGHPLYSITVTLFSMLVFAGAGSMLSRRWFYAATPKVWLIPVGLTVLLGLFVVLSPFMVASWIVWPKYVRMLVCIIILAPVSFLLGIPFSYGIQLLNKVNPSIIPWAWAVNGCMTVVGSILAVILSMNFGFNAVLLLSLLVYFISFLAITGKWGVADKQ